MKKFFFSVILMLIFSSIAYAIEVGGHLTNNTIWSPENNPYLVIDDVYVDDDVTLTILPGTIVKFNAAPLDNENSIDDYFVYYNGSNVAKMLWIDGNFIANGTEEEPITFTRIQDSLYYHWGIIYLRENADLCTFKYCTFEYSALMLIVLGTIPSGAISAYNEEVIIENCNFVDNLSGVYAKFQTDRIAITNNNFYNVENICPTYPGYYASKGIKISPGFSNEANNVLIAGNTFSETNPSWGHIDIRDNTPSFIIDNYFLGESGIHADMESDMGSYIYNNEFINCDYSGGIFGGEEDNSLYIKNNRFIGGNDGIDINNAYVEISDNYFEGCGLDTGVESSGKVFNNIIYNNCFIPSSYLEVLNNIGFNGSFGLIITYRNENCNNNISINNEYAFDGHITGIFNNCIFISNDEITQYGVSGNPIFRNCILDFELPPECIDGGGNIWVDELQAQELFEDIQNGDFHLIEGSLAIDAGFDTLGYYYPFDMDYNHRVWDGDGNGSAVIDIGAYEYGAPQLGKITGYITETDTGEQVDYALIKANNEPGNFTFADSAGYFEIQLPAGTYDLYAERVFYEDNIIYSVTVDDEHTTEIEFNMTSTLPQVGINEDELNINNLKLKISNYPNPFNPSTTISFSLTQNSDFVNLEIYNIKGQKVKTLINEEMQKGKHSIIWSGLDSNNKLVSSGIYLYKIKVGNQETIKRMLLLK